MEKEKRKVEDIEADDLLTTIVFGLFLVLLISVFVLLFLIVIQPSIGTIFSDFDCVCALQE